MIGMGSEQFDGGGHARNLCRPRLLPGCPQPDRQNSRRHQCDDGEQPLSKLDHGWRAPRRDVDAWINHADIAEYPVLSAISRGQVLVLFVAQRRRPEASGARLVS
ncbi:MAG: hypothetical protein H6R47_399 [Proteobacteria bacterium]|nr:hypothetical protein [Pseudomonadota bacterium]